jgi:hypothetical protein
LILKSESVLFEYGWFRDFWPGNCSDVKPVKTRRFIFQIIIINNNISLKFFNKHVKFDKYVFALTFFVIIVDISGMATPVWSFQWRGTKLERFLAKNQL